MAIIVFPNKEEDVIAIFYLGNSAHFQPITDKIPL
ncbi:MAG: hypothetical protein UV73_C0010G0024 [Candidatus Gottesmanbacteria bacterium GW2011_GWA2_43_14]|uniref:Uncharacterized protein n=1 Tax=Candidatus Gottesmanbacteria bacterium GW2011_GWA2_43_14 TaxID=1618443 RepID=A0A0G1DFL8_9BACT|nr:MAG: hypothetical protein UV73_C0010G0024 [Candidatus Gottesmanbacteria bacterium GW2011_GWA2_43_14]